MTTKKTVQMIALSGVLAIGVSGYAIAEENYYTTEDLLNMSENLPETASDEYKETLGNAIEANRYVNIARRFISEGYNVEEYKEYLSLWLMEKREADKKLAELMKE